MSKTFKFTKHELEQHYSNGLKQKEIATIYGCSREYICTRSKALGITVTPKTIKYPVDNNYFKTWSHEMSYILGFVMADGCIRKSKKNSYQLKIEVNQKDLEILEFIKDKISPTRPIAKNIKRINKSGTTSISSCLNITISKENFDLLNSFGIIPRKSGYEKIPNMPEKFKWSFVCGVFDGDGCVRKRDGKNQGGFDWGICTSSETLIQQLVELIPFGKTREQYGLWSISVRNKPQIRIVRNKLYENLKFSLSRKKKIMDMI